MTVVTGPGPFRNIADPELRPIWYLTPQRGQLFEIIPITANPPPGLEAPQVAPFLRRMLYLVKLHPPDLLQLVQDVQTLQKDRQMIAISAKLLNLIGQVFAQPWEFPAVLETADILRLRKTFSGVVGATNIPSNITSALPAAFALSFLSKFASLSVSNAGYAASLTNRHYGAYLQKMNDELNLRGVNASLTP